jgi:hypothetical protein
MSQATRRSEDLSSEELKVEAEYDVKLTSFVFNTAGGRQLLLEFSSASYPAGAPHWAWGCILPSALLAN